jgi:hypothetical protein
MQLSKEADHILSALPSSCTSFPTKQCQISTFKVNISALRGWSWIQAGEAEATTLGCKGILEDHLEQFQVAHCIQTQICADCLPTW